MASIKKKRGYRQFTEEEDNPDSAAIQPHLNKQEVLEMLKVSERTLQKWRNKGLLKFVKVGKCIWYPVEGIKAFMKNHTFGGKE